MTTLLYPHAPGQATLAQATLEQATLGQATLGQATACPFFSAIPRAVLERRKGRDLLTRDIEVLALLLDYKQRASTEVSPRQATLAGRLGCSADTIQRSVKRLMAAGLLAKTRLRDGKGRVERCVYDLAATLALMPVQAARLRQGEWGQEPGSERVSRPHGCGVSKADSESVVQADNSVAFSPAAVSPAAVSPVVGQLTARGVLARAAQGLVERFGEGRCREALSALSSRPSVRDKAAWLVAALRGNWSLAAPDPPDLPHSHRPFVLHSHRPFVPPLAVCGPPEPSFDPLAALPPSAWAALERQARDVLLSECTGPVLALLRQGRERRLVQARMRQMVR